jgi:O-antigen ligase
LLLPLSVLFIMVYPGLGTAYDSGEKVTYYIGVMTQKNELGVVCLICGLGSLGSFLTARGDREMPHRVGRMIAHSVVLVTALWLLKTSDSMTSLSTLVIAGTVMVMASRRWAIRRPSSLHAVVGGALALALFATFMDETGGLLRLIGRTATLTGRTEIWKAVLSFHTNPLVGTGYDSFWLGDRIEKVWRIIGYKGIAEAHNGYLEVYINLGSIGLLLLGWVILRGYRHALNGLRWDASAGGLRVAFVTAGLMYSLTEAGFRMMTPMWLAFLLELTCVPVSLRQDQRQRPESPVKEDALPRQRRLL